MDDGHNFFDYLFDNLGNPFDMIDSLFGRFVFDSVNDFFHDLFHFDDDRLFDDSLNNFFNVLLNFFDSFFDLFNN